MVLGERKESDAFVSIVRPPGTLWLGLVIPAQCGRARYSSGCRPRRCGVVAAGVADGKAPASVQNGKEEDGYSNVEVVSPEEMEELGCVGEVAGTPAAIDELRKVTSSGTQQSSMTALVEAAFPFEIDDFQVAALNHLANGKSVIVSAPTGSGKTLVGEAAIYLGLANSTNEYRRRVFYTTPLKALSNQKFYDFKKLFGEDRVGLLTGDTTVNREAEILVMTTEVYRNMLYASEAGEQQSLERGYSIGLVEDLFAVVFDEFHFMNDKDRGTVWEESVIISPSNILLVALSATIANTEDVRDWFADVHGPTELVTSSYRPVPLRFGFAARDGLYPLFAKRRSPAGGDSRNSNTGKIRLHPDILHRLNRARRTYTSRSKFVPGQMDFDTPSFNYLVRCLRRQDLLPAIVFIFSRAGCDRAALEAAKQEQPLVSEEESNIIAHRVDAFAKKHPGVVQNARLMLAKSGIASHHAGVLPLWKSVVEELFQDGLLKVIFATETLAAGINMPARTTVLSTLSKRSDDGFARLSTSATLQMAGRAGRRGKDVLGNSLIMQSAKEGPKEAYQILTAGVDTLESQFSPTYGMAMNLLQRRSIESIRELLDNSFASFLYRTKKDSSNNANDLDARSAMKYEAYERARKFLEEFEDQEALQLFQRLRLRLVAARQALSLEIQLEAQEKADMIGDMLMYAPPGTSVLLENPPRRKLRGHQNRRLPGTDEFGVALQEVTFREALIGGDLEQAVLVGVLEVPEIFVSKTQDPLYLCFTKTSKTRLVSAKHVKELEMDSEILSTFPSNLLGFTNLIESSQSVSIPPESPLIPEIESFRKYKGGQFRAPSTDVSIDISAMATVMPEPSHNDLVESTSATVFKLEKELSECSVMKCDDCENIVSAIRTVETLEKDVRTLRNAHKEMKGSSWSDFMAVTDLLTKYGFLEKQPSGIEVTSLGRLGACVNAENEVWVSMVLLSNELGSISPISFIGVLAAVIAEESNRVNTFIGVSASEDTYRMCEGLQGIAEQLRADQLSFGLDQFGAGTNVEEAALPEYWANGASWPEMLSVTSLQEGDICRKLRRVMDLLRQIPRLPEISESVKTNAKRALFLMNRFPIADDVTYTVSNEEASASLEKEEMRSFESETAVFNYDEELNDGSNDDAEFNMDGDEDRDDTLDDDDDEPFLLDLDENESSKSP